MKHFLFAILLGALSVVTASAEPITAAELATHLGICHWKAIVDLPHGSFSASLVEISDGKITHTLLGGLTATDVVREAQKVIAMASQDASGTTILSLVVGNSSTNNNSDKEKPIIPIGAWRGLPEKIKAGDYVLGGEYFPLNGITNVSGKVEDVKKGLALRIVPNSVEPTK